MSTYYALWYSGLSPAAFRATIEGDMAMQFEMFDVEQGAWIVTPLAPVQDWIDWLPLEAMPPEVQACERS